jgi:hypothetical protein
MTIASIFNRIRRDVTSLTNYDDLDILFSSHQEDGCGYSELDTLSMLSGAGLGSQQACDWLMALHGQLRDRLAASERPGLCDLLRSAMMVKQQQEKGVGLNLALKHAADNVYIRNMKSLASRQVSVDVILGTFLLFSIRRTLCGLYG